MRYGKYILAFVITAAIFATAFFISAVLNEKRIEDIRSIEARIAIDTLSLETQFDLLGEVDCSTLSENPILSSELGTLGNRLSFAEEELGADNEEVLTLKKQYTLLQIKDYLLMQKVREKCGLRSVFVLYFYSNADDCPDCRRAGEVLTYLRRTYPELRVYSFDYNLDLSALRTLIGLRDVEQKLPAFVVRGKPTYGFRTVEEMMLLIPELKNLASTSPREKN